jgi:hypothetical protein
MAALVLAIEPDLRQAAIVKRIVREKALADVTVVDSRDAAIEAMRTTMPDVLLLSALLSPRDEDELIAHLKTLENAGHLQTHTIPQLASVLGPGEERASRGLLSAFRRKKDPGPMASGCDPDLFAEEIRVYLQRAADKKRDLQDTDRVVHDMRPAAVKSTRAAAEQTEQPADDASASSSWASPFEWKPASSQSRAARTVTDPAPVAKAPERPTSLVSEPIGQAAGPLVDNFTASRSFLPDDAGPAPVSAPPVQSPSSEPLIVAPLIPEPAVTIPAPEPVVVAARAVDPAPVTIPAPTPVAPPPIAPVAAEPLPPPPAPAPAPAPVAAKAPAPEPVRLKPVAERAAQITARIQVQEVSRAAREAKEREADDCLGSLARWARIETPRASKSAPASSDDVRTLISSLAVPLAVASVRYPRGCRIRRVRVPSSPDADSSEVGPVILSRRALAEQREKSA